MTFEPDTFRAIVGEAHVLTGDAMAPCLTDWTGAYKGTAEAVIRPATPDQVAAIVREAAAAGLPITTQSGNTSVAGGSIPGLPGGIVLSLTRLNTLREIDTLARTATVDAGVVLETLQDRVAEHGLDFPLMFGARGSALIGGTLATNAGGSNVLRYGNARDLCLGIEAVLPNGQMIHGLTGLRKDNSGYDLKNLLIGSEGTLGIITGAVLKLIPAPTARSTAFLALSSMTAALEVLNTLQDGTGGLVEAFEWIPRQTVQAILTHNPGLRPPLDTPADTGILLELASSRPDDAARDPNGTLRLDTLLLELIEDLMERGLVIDGSFANSEQQRRDLWSLREEVLETIRAQGRFITLDASLPLSRVAGFLDRARPLAEAQGLQPILVGHLGDGNIHYAVTAAPGQPWSDSAAATFSDQMLDLIDDTGGSFSAEHGIGRSKTAMLRAYKDPAQWQMMREIKTATDPGGLFNPGVLFDSAA